MREKETENERWGKWELERKEVIPGDTEQHHCHLAHLHRLWHRPVHVHSTLGQWSAQVLVSILDLVVQFLGSDRKNIMIKIQLYHLLALCQRTDYLNFSEPWLSFKHNRRPKSHPKGPWGTLKTMWNVKQSAWQKWQALVCPLRSMWIFQERRKNRGGKLSFSCFWLTQERRKKSIFILCAPNMCVQAWSHILTRTRGSFTNNQRC